MSTSRPLGPAASAVRLGLALLLALSALAFATGAQASTTYPAAVADALEMPCVPACTLCHRDNNGGIRTVVQPFGLSMMDAGLKFFVPETVPGVLGTLEVEGTDSDGDGETDVDELRAGRDPNGDLDLCDRAAQYGCFNSIAPPRAAARTNDLTSAILCGLLIGLWLRRKENARAAKQSEGHHSGG